MPKLTIDGRETEVRNGATVMEAANGLGIYIPHFCYHKKLSIAANCRMCLVQIEKAPKPQPACATPVADGMEGVHALGLRQGGAGRRDGIPAHQPSARLPDLRPGRGMPAPGPRGRLRQERLALHRRETRGAEQESGPAHLDRHDALHPLHALRALRPGARRRHGWAPSYRPT